MLGLGLGLGKTTNIVQAAGGYDAATQAVIDYATTQGYTLGDADALNYWIVDSKSTGDWAVSDQIILSLTDGDNDYALINIKDPGTLNATRIGSPVYTSKSGYKAGATSGDIVDTNFLFLTNGTNATQNDNSRVVWVDAVTTPLSSTMRLFSSTGNNTIDAQNRAIVTTTPNFEAQPQTSTKSQISNLTQITGLYLDYRNSSTTSGAISPIDGSASVTDTTGSTPIQSYKWFRDRTLVDAQGTTIGLWMIGSSALRNYHADIKSRMATYKSMLP